MVDAVIVGGLRMIDDGEADDKIIAVLKGDPVMGQYKDLSECPQQVVDRIRHYFLTYKNVPGDSHIKCQIAGSYGKEEALEIIHLASEDYDAKYVNVLK